MRASAFLLISFALLTGCLSSGPLLSAQTKEKPTPAKTREATVIFIQPGTLSADAANDFQSVKCVPPAPSESGGLAPLLIPLAGMAADGLVNLVSTMLTKAKDDRTGTWSASVGDVALLPGKDYCLALSRGVISSAGNTSTSALNPGLSFEGEPAFVMFANISVTTAKDSETSVGLKLTPKLVSYAETSAHSRGGNKKDVSVLLAFSAGAKILKEPPKQGKSVNSTGPESGGSSQAATAALNKNKNDDAKKSEKQNAVADDDKKPNATSTLNTLRLDFGRLEIGKVYGAPLLLPVVASGAVDSGGVFTVSAVVTESEDPSVALAVFASAFDSNKDNLSTALKKALGAPQQDSKK